MPSDRQSTQTHQSSLVDPIEKIRMVFRAIAEADYDWDIEKLSLSGGRDSFVMAEAIRRIGGPEFGIDPDMAVHYQTGTNIPSTTRLVQEYCAEHDIPYVEGMNKTGKEMVGPQALDYGQYGAGEGRVMTDRQHKTAYVLRKERVEDGIYRGFDGDILSFSGTYADESDSRARKMAQGAIKWGVTGERKPRLTVCSPIYALTEGEVDELAERWDVPKAPAYDTLGSSGDCTMCAYDQAGRFRNLWAEAPNLAWAQSTLMVWTQMRRAAGHLNLPPERVLWGWGGLDDDQIDALRSEDTLYDPDDDIGPTSPDVACTMTAEDMESDDNEDAPEPEIDHQLKEFTCSSCDDRCEAAVPIKVADGGQVDG